MTMPQVNLDPTSSSRPQSGPIGSDLNYTLISLPLTHIGIGLHNLPKSCYRLRLNPCHHVGLAPDIVHQILWRVPVLPLIEVLSGGNSFRGCRINHPRGITLPTKINKPLLSSPSHGRLNGPSLTIRPRLVMVAPVSSSIIMYIQKLGMAGRTSNTTRSVAPARKLCLGGRRYVEVAAYLEARNPNP